MLEKDCRIIGTLDGPGSLRWAVDPRKASPEIRETVEWLRTQYKPLQTAQQQKPDAQSEFGTEG